MKNCDIVDVDTGLGQESVPGDDDQLGVAHEGDKDVDHVGVKCWWR